MPFDSKAFNGEVFGQYVDNIPKVVQNALKKAGIFAVRNDLKAMLSAQSGGNYITIPLLGNLSGDAQNYDGETDFVPAGTDTYTQSLIVTGRMKSWTERDFSFDIAGEDFMDNVASQIAEYWDEVDQKTLLKILEGIYGGTNDFVTYHTTDLSGTMGVVGPTSLNNAMTKAAGANKNIFKVAIMHSTVASNLENQQLLEYVKYTDAAGMTKDTGLATWNGRLVLIDDDVPHVAVNASAGTAGVHQLNIGTAAVATDTVTINGVTYTCVASGATGKQFNAGTAAEEAAALAVLCAAEAANSGFSVTNSTTKVVFTQNVNGTGAIPTLSKTGTVVATISTTTAGVAANAAYTKYTTYILGENAFTFCDVGAKVPYEMNRDPKTNGGQDTLYTRQRKVFSPFGFDFLKTSMAKSSPTDTELATAANWGLVNNGQDTPAYIDHKAICIARIISLG